MDESRRLRIVERVRAIPEGVPMRGDRVDLREARLPPEL